MMTASKFTPGPWAIRRGHSTVEISTTAGLQIAQTTGDAYWQNFTAEALANARLIAAAPAMYAALKAFVAVAEKQGQRWRKRLPEGNSPLGLAIAALSQANGDQP